MSPSTHSATEALKNYKCKYRQRTYSGNEAFFVYVAKDKQPRVFSEFSSHIIHEFVVHLRSTHLPDVPSDVKDQAAVDYIMAHHKDVVQTIENTYLKIEKEESGSSGSYETTIGTHADGTHYR